MKNAPHKGKEITIVVTGVQPRHVGTVLCVDAETERDTAIRQKIDPKFSIAAKHA